MGNADLSCGDVAKQHPKLQKAVLQHPQNFTEIRESMPLRV